MRTSILASCFIAMTVPAVARAGQFDDPPIHGSLFAVNAGHLDGGIEWMTGGDHASTAFRGHAVIGHRFDVARAPYVAVGATLAVGQADIENETATFVNAGPELQGGVELGQVRLYVDVAAIHTSIGSGLDMSVPTGWGARAGVGVDLSAFKWRAVDKLFDERDPGSAAIGTLVMAIPTHVELAWDDSTGTNRAGVVLAWGL